MPKINVQPAVEILRTGGVIAFPTETTYGLGCDPRDEQAVRRIFAIKGRSWSKPLLLVAGSWKQVRQVVRVNAAATKLAKKYWPGPLTLVLPIKENTKLVNGVILEGEVSIRYSSSPLVRLLTRQFGFPIVATSANRAGLPDSRSAQEVKSAGLEVDYIVDGGALPVSKTSTLARVKSTGEIEVIREGAISLRSPYEPNRN